MAIQGLKGPFLNSTHKNTWNRRNQAKIALLARRVLNNFNIKTTNPLF